MRKLTEEERVRLNTLFLSSIYSGTPENSIEAEELAEVANLLEMALRRATVSREPEK